MDPWTLGLHRSITFIQTSSKPTASRTINH